jgi:hypothetical protein
MITDEMVEVVESIINDQLTVTTFDGYYEVDNAGEIARAALEAVLPMIRAEVLEEAAKVTENAFTQECCGLGVGSPMECCADPICVALAPHEIAAAIRAMKGDGI